MTVFRPSVRVLVCGNVDRRDDGAAIWAIGHLLPGTRAEELPGICLVRCNQLKLEDLLDGAPGAPVLIVDTAVGIPAGRIVTLTFDELLARRQRPVPQSSHELPIAEVIGVARELRGPGVDGLFVGIGAADVGYGHSLSAPVREGMGEFVVAIEKALMRLTSATTPAAAPATAPATA